MPKRGYHHGNLAQALVDAALELIRDKGPTGFTLSEAAKEAGVTPAAVYRHFQGRDDLIAECARQGFELFHEALSGAYGEGRAGPLAAFEATGQAYLDFARRHPGHYIAMFESGVNPEHTPALSQANQRARAVLERAAAGLTAHMPAATRPPAQMVAAHIWALAHGVVELFARPGPGASPFAPDLLLESGVGIYLRGLGILPHDR